MIKSESIANLVPAYLAFQNSIENPTRNATNPFFNSRYTTLDVLLDHVKPILGAHKLSITQLLDGNRLVTLLVHESGEYWGSSIELAVEKNSPQAQGIAITYARRYAIDALCCISSEQDTDGNTTSKPQGNSKTVDPFTDL